MLLLFLDDIKSETELMQIIPERLDYLWFLGYELDDEIPHHGCALLNGELGKYTKWSPSKSLPGLSIAA